MNFETLQILCLDSIPENFFGACFNYHNSKATKLKQPIASDPAVESRDGTKWFPANTNNIKQENFPGDNTSTRAQKKFSQN